MRILPIFNSNKSLSFGGVKVNYSGTKPYLLSHELYHPNSSSEKTLDVLHSNRTNQIYFADPMESVSLDIKKEVEELVKSNKYKTITLLGQNVNSYGNDFKDGKTNFVYLLKTLCEIEGDFKLKFMTSHPKDFSPELIDFIASNPKMSKAIHLPVQSGSNEILKIMNRRYTIEHYKNLVDNIYRKIGGATLTTDIIVGFPGETDDDFNKTCELLEYCKYSGVFGFVYSKRKGTPAEKFENQVSIDIKRKRITKLFEIKHRIVKQLADEMIDKVFEVLVEDKIKNYYIAKTDAGKTIKIKESEELNINLGEFYKVKIKKALTNELVGEIIK